MLRYNSFLPPHILELSNWLFIHFLFYGLKICKAMVGSWLWQFILPLLPLLTGALGTFSAPAEGHETRYICYYLCFISRSQPNFWICFCTFYWGVFSYGDGQGNSVINKHLYFIYQETEIGIIYPDVTSNQIRTVHKKLINSLQKRKLII